MIYFGNTQPNPLESKVWLLTNGLLKTYNSHTKQWNGVSSMLPPTDNEQPDLPKEIEFTINRDAWAGGIITCKALEGMTWREWYHSDYAKDAIATMETGGAFQTGELEFNNVEEPDEYIRYSYFWRNFISAWGGDGLGLCFNDKYEVDGKWYNRYVLVNADKQIIAEKEYVEEYSDRFEDLDSTQPSLINFTIQDREYQAEEGMTWSQFINSSYNVNDFFLLEYLDSIIVAISNIWGATYEVVSTDADNPVLIGDQIIPSCKYTVLVYQI